MNAALPVNDRLLRTALRGNGIFSALSGGLLLVASRPLAEWLGVSSAAALLVLGIILLLYAVDLFWVTTGENLSLPFAWFAIIMDVIWVIGSIILLVIDPLGLTVAGKWAIGLVAEVVALFAIAQWLGVRRLNA